MKSERRHELQRNALESEMVRIWEFLRRRGNLIAWGTLAVAAIVLGIVWYVKRVRSDTEMLQAQFARIVVPVNREQNLPEDQRQAGLEKIAADKSQPLWAANAAVKMGDDVSLRMVDEWYRVTESDRTARRAQAQTYYQQALADSSKTPVTAAMAHYGLGKLAEDWSDVAGARKEYEEAVSPGEVLSGQPIAYVVREALGRLGQFEGRVYMPTSAPATGPASGPASAPAARASQPVGATGPAPASQAAPVIPAASAPAETPKTSPAKTD